MKRENCEFGMNYTSEIGSLAKNNSYFDFVELDNFACWVAADETTGDDKQIAIMVVHSIIKNFKQKPTMSQRGLNKYISEARELVIHIKGNRRMNVGLAVVITDYTRMVCIASGNEKIFLFKGMSGLLGDATVELSANDSEKKDFWIEPSQEDFVFGSLIWKLVKLQDGDVALIGNSGFWKKVDQDEITNALNGVKEPYMFIYNLKYLLLSKQDPSLVSYTIAAIFAFRVAKAGMPKWLKSFAVVTTLLLMAFGVWHYHVMDRLFPKAQEQPQEPTTTTPSGEYVTTPYQTNTEAAQRGDQYVRSQEYVKALEEYNKAVNGVLSGDKTSKANLQRKIEITQLIIEGDKLAATGANEVALVKYNLAQQAVMGKKDYDTTGLQKRITTVQGIVDVKKGVAEGDRESSRKNYQAALDAYTHAAQLAEEVAFDTGRLGLNQKIKQTEKRLANEEAAATKLENEKANSQALLEEEKNKSESSRKSEIAKVTPALKTETAKASPSLKPGLSKEPARQSPKTQESSGSKWVTHDFANRVEPPANFMEGNNKFLMANFCTIKNGALVMNTTDNPAAGPNYKLTVPPDRKIGFKFTAVARVKVENEYGMDFDLRAAGLRERIRLMNSGVKLETTGNRSGFIKTSEWHTYCMTFEVVDEAGTPTLLTKIYIDGASHPVIESKSTTADSNNYFRFGDCSSSNGYLGQIDWIVWNFNEAGKPGHITLPAGYRFN